MTTTTRKPKPALDIFICVPGLPFNGDTIKTKSLGGSESAGAYLARELAALGHRVRVFSNGEPGIFDEVTYSPLEMFEGYATKSPSDVVIVQRVPEIIAKPFMTKLTILWNHDLGLKRNVPIYRSTQWAMDKVAVVSEFMATQYKETVNLEKPLVWVTRNGIDQKLRELPTIECADRDRDLILYAARPERGLEVLLGKVFPEIRKLRPTAKLAICTYDNPSDAMTQTTEWYAALKKQMADLGVQNLGALSKPELYAVMQRAGAYVYPTPGPASPMFREVSCISALEAQACGLPFFSTATGALPETAAASPLGDVEGMAERVVTLLADPVAYKLVQDAQFQHLAAGRYDWAQVAQDWEAMFFSEFARVNDDPVRLAAWFYRRSDIEFASHALADPRALGPIADDLRAKIDTHYAFRKSEADYAEQYAAMGRGTDDDLKAKDDAGLFTKDYVTFNPEHRFAFMRDVLKTAGAKNVFDVGCGHGWSPIYLHNNLKVPVYGFDVDPSAVRWSTHFASKIADFPGMCNFTSNEQIAFKAWPASLEGYDAMVCSEVLEHVLDPAAFLERAEGAVRKGGMVAITVPFGPWEFGGPNWVGLRAHIRELSQSDLNDMIGHKPEFRLGAMVQNVHPQLGEPCGFLMATYRADHTPVRPIDVERKMLVQRPRETLSVNILVGPGSEKTIAWTLDSVRPIADEIIVVNCGASDLALEAARTYECKIVESESPLKVGFDTARNVGLAHSTGDWVLWIDSDEALCDGLEMAKYLRRNDLAGYTLNQVHMAVDATIPRDTPVRVIRTNKGLKFFGHIHEHPETEMNKGPGVVAMISNPQIAHLGYMTNQTRSGRFYRNRPMMDKDHERFPGRALGYHLEARDQCLVLNEMLARTNGQVIPAMLPIAEEALRCVREFEKLAIPLMGIDPTEYKTAALRILNRGFEASVDIKLGRDNVGDRGPLAMRFETMEEFNTYVAKGTKDKLEAITGEMF